MNDNWRTPPYLYRYADMRVGGFQYDAACRKHNALAAPVAKGFGDALIVPWNGRTWCNPPYSNIDPWLDPFFSCDDTAALLIPQPNGEARYERLIRETYEISIIGRIGFLDADGNEIKGNPRGSSIFIRGDNFEPGKREVVLREEIRRLAA